MFEEFEGYSVVRAILHQSFQVPTHGEANSLYAKPGEGIGRSALTNVAMKFNGVMLVCKFKDREFIIPAANIVGVYL